MDLSDAQWAVLEPLIPPVPRRPDGRGRPWRDPRDVVNGVLWVLRTGAPWNDLPSRYPPSSTCHRRFQTWVKDGTLVKALRALDEDLKARGKLDFEEAFVDGTHAGAKRGDPWWARNRRGNATKIMAMADGNGLPLSATLAAGQRNESPLVGELVDARFTGRRPKRVICDRAYDSQRLDDELKSKGIELIAPKIGQKNLRHPRRGRRQDGRSLRRYRRRWKIERLFAWLFNSRRLVTRYEATPPPPRSARG